MTKTHPELGVVRRCPRCRGYFPLDLEFWYRRRKPWHGDDWLTYCRACYSERRHGKGATQVRTDLQRARKKVQDAARYLRRKAADPEGLAARSRATSKAFYWRNADLERERERAVRAAKAAAEGRTIRVGFGRPRIAA